ncbi:ylmG homolog protein 2, chloroplastic-like [Rutidosis leptorrhynchoides]|uniref:ylmG homolog protein 2, chloroplastic-like n=1 Tax=Rutidosis leptorrhynchoides TaxID=125765 RepID=UPI003A99C710
MNELQSSMASTADKCLTFLHSLASQNPVIGKILSFSSHFHQTQIQCRNYKNRNTLSNHNFAAILPGDSVAGVVVASGISNFLNIYNTLLICRLVLTWFPNAPPAIVSPLSTLCDPYLNIFRGLIPPLGGTLDFSPILAFLVLNALTSTAAALPAELPQTGESHKHPSSRSIFTNLTSSQKKWMRRLGGEGDKSADVNEAHR